VVRLLLLSSPAVAALIVAWAVLGGGSEQVRYVQVLGGPTRTAAGVAVLLRALRADADRATPLSGVALSARLRSANESLVVEGKTDADGLYEARFELARAPGTDPWLEVEELASTSLLAAGPLSLGVDAWSAGARRNGGWTAGQTRGELEVAVAAEDGIFAVPFAGHLLVRTFLGGLDPNAAEPGPVAGASVSLELEGAELVAPGPVPATDGQGITRVLLRPLEHAVSVRASVKAGSREGHWYGALPILPGALAVSLEPNGVLTLRSPVVRDRAYLSLVTQNQRLAGAIVPLVAESDGTASGRLPLAPPWLARAGTEPVWAVVSSEFDKRSPAVVGWPLPSNTDVPRLTFDVADRVLLDGRDAALYEVRQRRRARRRVAALALFGVGLSLSLAFWLEVRGQRRGASGTVPGTELPALAPRGWVLGLALGCIVLGLGALGYFGLLER
jgi:hypothetical protein